MGNMSKGSLVPNSKEAVVNELDFFKQAIDLLPNPVYIKNRSHKWVEVNQSFCKFLGFSREELLGKSDFDFNPPDQARVFWEKDNLVLTTKKENINIEQTTNSRGDVKWVRSRKTFFQTQQGEDHIIGVLDDITTDKIREDKLFLSEKKARSGIRERAKFLTNIGYNIRGPIGDISKMTAVMRDLVLDEEQNEVIEGIERANNLLTRMIDDIMDLTHIDAGLMKLVSAAFNVSEAVESISSILGAEARNKGIDLIVDISPDLPEMVIGDSQRLQQILMNLIENGIKFTDSGFVSVSVWKSNSSNDNQLIFKVKDTGNGIPDDVMEQIFGKFVPNDGPLEKLGGIAGIGLPLCRKLSHLMGGVLTAKTTEGEGSELCLSLILPSQKECERKTVERPVVRLVPPKQKHKILIVDDIRTNYDILSVLLETMNIEADYAESARRAVHKLVTAYNNGNPYTLMMVDYCMPETDGLLLTSHLRQSAKFANLNIIAVSAVNDPEIMRAFLANGVIDYLVKPVRLKTLKASLSKVPLMGLTFVA